MNIYECETCIKRKTTYCPNSNKCLNTENKPYYQNRIMLLEENKELNQKYLNAVSDYEQEKFNAEELKKQVVELEESSGNVINNQVARGIDLVNQQKMFVKYLEDELKECNFYSKYIEKKAQELKGRRAGRTYIANEIIKNECAKKQIKEILSKYKEILEGKNEN